MTEPTRYRVTWDIEVRARTPTEAAQEARQILRDPDDARALVFLVKGAGDLERRIDLDDPRETDDGQEGDR